jgi:NMD protein affecting ribosome stability and mRNA decay
MSPSITYFGLFILVLTILLLLRKMRQTKLQIAGYGTQRMCSSCGLITSRLKASLLGVRQVSYKGSVFGYTKVNRDSQRMVVRHSVEVSLNKSRFYVKNPSGKDFACDVLGRTMAK